MSLGIPFDPIMTLVVFLIGVPALIQFLPINVRRIILSKGRRRKQLALAIGLPMIISVVVVFAGLTTEFFFVQDNFIHELKWTVIIIILVVFTGWLGIYIPFQYGRRENIVAILKKDALRMINVNGRLVEEPVEDLIDLGAHAESSQEQYLVLDALSDLIRHSCSHPAYNGDSLETPILKLVDVIANSNVRSIENFRMASEILQLIPMARKEVQYLADLQRTVKVAAGLGRAALEIFENDLETDNIVLSYVQTLSLINYVKSYDATQNHSTFVLEDVSEALFEIGSLAIEKHRNFIGVAVLDKMITMLYKAPNILDEKVLNVLEEISSDATGLIAHLWIEGDSQKEFVLQKIPEVEKCVGQPFSNIIKKARSYYLGTIQFQTANKLAQMAEDLKPKPRLRKKK